MREHVNLKLKSLLEAPQLTPEEAELVRKLQLWAKGEHQGEYFRFIHLLVQGLGFGLERPLSRRHLRDRQVLATVAVGNERANVQDPAISPESPGRHGSIIQLVRFASGLAIDSMTFEHGKPVLYGDPANHANQEIGTRYVQLPPALRTETVHHTNTPGEAHLCKQIEEWVQHNLTLWEHSSAHDPMDDIWRFVLHSWDFSYPDTDYGRFYVYPSVDTLLVSDPIAVSLQRTLTMNLHWLSRLQQYLFIGEIRHPDGRVSAYYYQSSRQGPIR